VLEWLPTLHIGVLTILTFWLPGLAVGYAAGLRGLVAWGSAPILSSAVIGVSAVGGGLVGLPWSWLLVAGGTAAASGIAWLVRLASRRWRSPFVTIPSVRRRVVVAATTGLLVAGALQARRLLSAIGSPTHFPQTYDTPYHLNSLRLILETGNASSMNMTLTTPELSTSFYPGLWHGITSLVMTTIGSTDVVVAANWVTIVIASLVWPASMLVLARALFGPRPMMLGFTAVLSFAMTQFPNQLTAFGILYPNLLSYALLPAALGLGWLLLWRARGRARLAPLYLLGLSILAITLAQPNGLFTLGYVAVPLLAHFVGHHSLRLWRAGRRTASIGSWLVTVVVFVAVYWGVGRIPMVAEFRQRVTWPARLTETSAVNDVIDLSALHPTGHVNTLIAALVLVGAVTSVVVARWRWLPLGYLVLGWLFVVSISGEESVREVVTGYWYGDPERLAAQLPLLAVPLAVVGLTVVCLGLSNVAQGARPEAWWNRATSPTVLSVAAAVLLLLVLPRTGTFLTSFDYVRSTYATPTAEQENGFVDEDEVAMMETIAEVVPEDAVVAGNPWNGASMTWALADREALFPHGKILTTADQELIAQSLDDAGDDPAVCAALERTGVGYALTSRSMLWGNDPPGFEGLDVSSVRQVSELVAREGDVRLWRITAC
jgi:hypothetical protein